MSVTRRSSSRYALYVFWVMFSINFLNYLDRYVLAGAAKVIAQELGFGLDGIGYIASAFLIVYTLGTLPLGIWADRAKRKNVVAICVAVWSLTTAFTALAFNFTTLFLSRMVLGIGEAGYFPAGTALMSDYFSREKRSRIMSWWNCGQLIGILVGFVDQLAVRKDQGTLDCLLTEGRGGALMRESVVQKSPLLVDKGPQTRRRQIE